MPDLQDCAVCCCHCGIRFFAHPCNACRRDLRCPFGCREHHHRQLGNARSRKHNQTDEGRANKKKLNTAARIKAGQAASRGTVPSDTAPSDTAPSDTAPSDTVPSDTAPSDTAPPTPVEQAHRSPVEQAHRLTADSPSADISDAATVDEFPSVDPSPAMWEHLALHLDGFVLDEPTLVNSRILPYVQMVASVLEGRTISRVELLTALRKSLRQRSIGRLPRREYVLRYLNGHPP